MQSLESLLMSISRFYHRWDALERTLGSDGGSVLDFDFCPRAHVRNLEGPFESRLAALRVLEDLRRDLAGAPASALANAEMLAARLEGSAAYLRALLGQYYSYAEYVHLTMGHMPVATPPERLETLRNAAVQALARVGIPFEERSKELYEQRMVEENVQVFIAELEAEIPARVDAIRRSVGLSAEPYWRLEIQAADAYWANWIHGGLDEGIILKINTHPRIRFNRHSGIGFAAHEVGGHALNVLELARSAQNGLLDSPLLCLTVHACEAFQMEGLAQTVLELTTDVSSLPVEVQIEDALRALSGALMNDAQLRLEAGEDVITVYNWLKQQNPLLKDHKVLPELRDRARNPLYRSYIGVYAPSKSFFQRAHALPWDVRMSFLRQVYSALYTPRQLKVLLEQALAKTVSTGNRIEADSLVT